MTPPQLEWLRAGVLRRPRQSLPRGAQSPPNGAPVDPLPNPLPNPFPPLPLGAPVLLLLLLPPPCVQFQLIPEHVHVMLS